MIAAGSARPLTAGRLAWLHEVVNIRRRIGSLAAAALIFTVIAACICPMPASAEVAGSCCTSEDGWSTVPAGCCLHACEDPELVTAQGVAAPSAFENSTMDWDLAPTLAVVDLRPQPAPEAGTTTHTILRS